MWLRGTIAAVKEWVKKETAGMCGAPIVPPQWTQKESDAIEAEKQETMHRKRVEKYYAKPLQYHADQEGSEAPGDEFKESHPYVSPTPDLDALCERVKNNEVPIWMKTFKAPPMPPVKAPATPTVAVPMSEKDLNRLKQEFQDLHTGPPKIDYAQEVLDKHKRDLQEPIDKAKREYWGAKFEGSNAKIAPPMGPTERRLTNAYNQIVQEQASINLTLQEKVGDTLPVKEMACPPDDDMWGLRFVGGQPKKVTFAEHAADEIVRKRKEFLAKTDEQRDQDNVDQLRQDFKAKTDEPLTLEQWNEREDEKAKGGNWKPSNPKDLMGIRKVSFACLPWPVIGEGALGMQEGGFKYGRHNYRDEGVAASTYVDAAMRHLLQFWEGEDIDEESGIHHIGKAISTLFVLRDAQLNDMCTDDRPIRPKNVSWLKDLNVKASLLVDKYPQPEKPYTHKPLPERK